MYEQFYEVKMWMKWNDKHYLTMLGSVKYNYLEAEFYFVKIIFLISAWWVGMKFLLFFFPPFFEVYWFFFFYSITCVSRWSFIPISAFCQVALLRTHTIFMLLNFIHKYFCFRFIPDFLLIHFLYVSSVKMTGI